MKDVRLSVHVAVKTFNLDISRCYLADYDKEFNLGASRTCSTPVYFLICPIRSLFYVVAVAKEYEKSSVLPILPRAKQAKFLIFQPRKPRNEILCPIFARPTDYQLGFSDSVLLVVNLTKTKAAQPYEQPQFPAFHNCRHSYEFLFVPSSLHIATSYVSVVLSESRGTRE